MRTVPRSRPVSSSSWLWKSVISASTRWAWASTSLPSWVTSTERLVRRKTSIPSSVVGEHELALLGHLDRAAGTAEDLDPELGLETADLLGDRGLGEVQLVGCLAEGAV